MKVVWLHKQKNEKLILFFSGWALDEKPFSPLDSLEYDVLMIHSFHTDDFPESLYETFHSYKDVTLVGWSMGVYMAGLWCSIKKTTPTLSIALNGSLKPLDAAEGIPLRLFKRTGDRLNLNNRNAFFKNMFIEEETKGYQLFVENKPTRELDEQKDEIYSLIKHSEELITDFEFDIALMGSADKIFPIDNLKEHWKDRGFTLNLPHFLFYEWNSWDEIVQKAFSYTQTKHSN